MGCGPGQVHSIFIRKAAARAGPTNQSFRSWAAARPSPLHFQFCTAQPINLSRLGAAHDIFKSLGPARPAPDKRPITSPVKIHVNVLIIMYVLNIQCLEYRSTRIKRKYYTLDYAHTKYDYCFHVFSFTPILY